MSPTNHSDHTITITVEQSPDEVFAAITDVRGWWNDDIIGATTELHDQFVFYDGRENIRFCRFRLAEVVPGRRVVWHVVDAYLGFIGDHDEWTDTNVVFDISASSDRTTLRFTHEGLTPASECFDACSRGWDFYINRSLPQLLATGTGDPIRGVDAHSPLRASQLRHNCDACAMSGPSA